MEEADRLRARARHCRNLANETADEEIRCHLLRIAEERDAAAKSVEARRHDGAKSEPGFLSRLRSFFSRKH